MGQMENTHTHPEHEKTYGHKRPKNTLSLHARTISEVLPQHSQSTKTRGKTFFQMPNFQPKIMMCTKQ